MLVQCIIKDTHSRVHMHAHAQILHIIIIIIQEGEEWNMMQV